MQLLSRVLSFPLALITLGVTTRYLGTQDYGVLITAVVFVGLFETFVELGVGTIIVRRVAAGNGSLSRLVGLNLALSTAYAVPLALLCAGTGLVVYSGRTTEQLAVLVISSGLVLAAVATCFDPVFDVHVRYTAVAVSDFLSRVFSLGTALAVVALDAGLLAMCLTQVVPHLVRLVVTAIAARRLERVRMVVEVRTILGLLREGLPLTVIIAISVAYWRADGVLLSVLSSPAEVAAYGLALQVAFSLTMLPQVFTRTMLSTINEGYATGTARFQDTVQQSYRFLLMCAVPVAVLGWPLAPRIVDVLTADDFVERAGPVLQLFFVAAAVGFLAPLLSDALIAAHQQRFLTVLSTVNLAGNVGLNLLLIPVWGARGCAVALIASETAGMAVAQWRLRRGGVTPLPLSYPLRLVPGVALALVAMWATWSLPLVVPVAVAAVAYPVGLLATGAVPREMRTAVRDAVRRRRRAPADSPA